MATYAYDTAPWENGDETPWDETYNKPSLTAAQFEAQRKHAMGTLVQPDSALKTAAEFGAGLTGIQRYLTGVVSPEAKENLFPTQGIDKTSGAYVTGSILDPAAWLSGAKAFQIGAPVATSLGIRSNTLRNMFGGALSGGTVGGLTEGQSAITGTLTGAGFGALSVPASTVYSKLKGIFGSNAAANAAMHYLAKVFPTEAELNTAINRLLALKPTVPGEKVTAGMAAVGGKGQPLLPKLAALEEEAASRGYAVNDLVNIRAHNEEVRENVLNWIAKPGTRLPAAFEGKVPKSVAESARTSITVPIYKQARNDLVPIDDTLGIILEGPLVRKLETKASNTFEQLVANTKAAGRVAPKVGRAEVPEKLVGVPEWSMAAPYKATPAKPAEISIGLLQDLRQDINKRISILSKSSSSADVNERRLLSEANRQLDDWMRTKSQKWADAQDTFKFLSEVQNQADVAIILGKALKSPAGDERLASFLSAIRNAPQTLKKATGDNRYEDISQVLTPTQMRNVQQVIDSLKREATYTSLTKGKSLLPEHITALQEIEGYTPPLLSALTTSVRKLLTKAGTSLSDQGKAYIDNLVVNDPRGLAELLKRVSEKERILIMRRLHPSEKPGMFIGASVSGTKQE